MREGVLDNTDDVVHGSHIELGEGILASGNDLLLHGLDEGESEDGGKEGLEEILVLPRILPDANVGVELEGGLVSLIDADEDILVVRVDDANTVEEALNHGSGVIDITLLDSGERGADSLGRLRKVDELHNAAELVAILLKLAVLHSTDGGEEHFDDRVAIDLEVILEFGEEAAEVGGAHECVVVSKDGQKLLNILGADVFASGQALDGGLVGNNLDEEATNEVADSSALVGRPLRDGQLESLIAQAGGKEGLVLVLDADKKSKDIEINAIRLEHARKDLSKLLLLGDLGLNEASEGELLLGAAEENLGGGLADVSAVVEPVLRLVGGLSSDDVLADLSVVDNDVLDEVVLEGGRVSEDLGHILDLLPVGLHLGAVSLELLDIRENGRDVLNALGAGDDRLRGAVTVGLLAVACIVWVFKVLLASYDVSFIIRLLDWLDYNNNFLAMFYLV
jgi:hypothetical protein